MLFVSVSRCIGKQNAAMLKDRAMKAQARLNIKKAQQKLIQSQKPLINIKP